MSIEVINYDNYDKKAILKPSYLIGVAPTPSHIIIKWFAAGHIDY